MQQLTRKQRQTRTELDSDWVVLFVLCSFLPIKVKLSRCCADKLPRPPPWFLPAVNWWQGTINNTDFMWTWTICRFKSQLELIIVPKLCVFRSFVFCLFFLIGLQHLVIWIGNRKWPKYWTRSISCVTMFPLWEEPVWVLVCIKSQMEHVIFQNPIWTEIKNHAEVISPEMISIFLGRTFGPLFLLFHSVESSTSSLFWQDMRPLKAGRCQYYSSGGGNGYVYENFYTSVSSR